MTLDVLLRDDIGMKNNVFENNADVENEVVEKQETRFSEGGDIFNEMYNNFNVALNKSVKKTDSWYGNCETVIQSLVNNNELIPANSVEERMNKI